MTHSEVDPRNDPRNDDVEDDQQDARLDPARALDEAEERVFGSATDQRSGEDREADPVDDSGTGLNEESPG